MKSDIAPGAKDRWQAIAQQMLKKTGSYEQAETMANMKTRSAAARKLLRRQVGS